MTIYLGTPKSKAKDKSWMTATYIQQPEEKDGPCKYSQVVGDEGMEMIPRWAWQAPAIPETPALPTPVNLIYITICFSPCKYSQVVGDEGMEMIPRWAWQAPAIPETPALPTPVNLIRLTITGGQPCKTYDKCCKALKKLRVVFNRQKGIDDVPFNFMIGADGRVYEGRGWTLKPYSDPLFNPELMGDYLEIGFIGKYDSKYKEPWACRGTASMLIRYGVKMGFIGPEHHAETDYKDKLVDFFSKPMKLNRWLRPHTTRKTR